MPSASLTATSSPELGSPRVSVVLPCFHQAHLLPEAVASVVAQTFTSWEVLIVTDGKSDDAREAARRLIRQSLLTSIRLIDHTGGGPSAARNAAIRAARGRYVLPLDLGDTLHPTMLEKLVRVLDHEPQVGFVYSDIQYSSEREVHPLPAFDARTLITRDDFRGAASLVRKEAWMQVGGYDERLGEGYEDWDVWIGCVEKGWLGKCVHEPLYCRSGSPTNGRADAKQARQRLIARVVLNHPQLYDEPSQARAREVLEVATPAVQTAPRGHATPASALRPRLRVRYLITNIQGLTGGNQTLLRQADELCRRGHDVTLVTYTPRPGWFDSAVRVVQVPPNESMAMHVPPSDAVISTYFANTRELLAVQAPVKVYYAQGDQYVFGDATTMENDEVRALRELSWESYQLPGVRFVPNSHNLARVVERHTGRRPDGLLPVCTDQTIFRPLGRALPGSVARLLIVGPDTLGTPTESLLFKGIQDIHDALLLLRKRYPYFTAVRMAATRPEIFAHCPCEFYVAPSDEVKTFLYGTAHLLIYASHYDSCPRPPQEAMAAGCAVICTRTPGAMEYCRDGENCLLVPIQSPPAIAEAVERLLTDHPLHERLVQGGLATARQYPREREWDELEALLYRFMDEARSNR